jgi:hypothetical protein
MNSIRMMPLTNPEKPPCIGLNQDQAGVMELAGWLPVPTRTSAVTEKASSMNSSTPSRTRWNQDETSMPR